MEIISRHSINPEIRVFSHIDDTQCSDYTEFCLSVDYWKTLLVEKYNVKPGQTIFIECGPNIYYYTVLFAAVELGLVLIVDWPHCYSERDLDDYKVTIFGEIDYIISSRAVQDVSNPKYNQWDHKRNLRFGKNIILQEEFDEYQIQDHELFKNMSSTIWATPDSPMIYSFSSGTTGLPKKVVNTHRKVYLMSQRMAKILFEPNDSVLHVRNIHHGASICYYFLPAFMVGKDQYTRLLGEFNRKDIEDISDYVTKHQINQIFCYITKFLTIFMESIAPVDFKLNISTLYQIPADLVTLVKQKNITSVRSLFGDTTIGLGFFVKLVDQATDLDQYDVTNMGPKLDEFYDFKIQDNHLYISIPSLGEDWVTSNDCFELVNEDYIFKGRANQYRINGEWIKLNDIESKVRELFGRDGANILVDGDYQRIYLAIWVPNASAEQALEQYLKEQYKNVQLSFVLRDARYEHFYNARKIDNSKLRQYCREVFEIK